MEKIEYKDVDDYIVQAAAEVQDKLKEFRRIIRANAPEAEENVSYGMPAYKYLGRPLVYFGAFKNHVSLFAAGSQMVAKKFAKELEGLIQSKGTIQFPLDGPLPADLIAKIVKARVEENEERNK